MLHRVRSQGLRSGVRALRSCAPRRCAPRSQAPRKSRCCARGRPGGVLVRARVALRRGALRAVVERGADHGH
eukprot:11266471-Alexandrium_andersonii.AAC.1